MLPRLRTSKRVYDKALDALTDAIVGEGAAGGCGTQSAERVITLQLGASKVQKLLDLLLQ